MIVAEFIERESRRKDGVFVNPIQQGSGAGGKTNTEDVRRGIRSKVTRKPAAVRWI